MSSGDIAVGGRFVPASGPNKFPVFAPTNFLKWRPDGTGDIKTWADIAGLIPQVPPMTIWVDDPTQFYEIDVSVNVNNLTIMMPGGFGESSLNMVVDNGVLLTDLYALRGPINFKGSGGGPSLAWSATNGTQGFFVDYATVTGLGGIGDPLIVIPDNGSLNVSLYGDGNFKNLLGGFANIGVNSALSVGIRGGVLDDQIVSSTDSTGRLFYVHDGSLQSPLPDMVTGGAFTGTIFNRPFCGYGGAGPTAFRPDSPNPGVTYFDTDLALLIVNGVSGWTNAVGTPV